MACAWLQTGEFWHQLEGLAMDHQQRLFSRINTVLDELSAFIEDAVGDMLSLRLEPSNLRLDPPTPEALHEHLAALINKGAPGPSAWALSRRRLLWRVMLSLLTCLTQPLFMQSLRLRLLMCQSCKAQAGWAGRHQHALGGAHHRGGAAVHGESLLPSLDQRPGQVLAALACSAAHLLTRDHSFAGKVSTSAWDPCCRSRLRLQPACTASQPPAGLHVPAQALHDWVASTVLHLHRP